MPYTSDPHQNLADAYLTSDTGRFLPAERFANEALEAFKAIGNKTWQAEAHFFLGGLNRESERLPRRFRRGKRANHKQTEFHTVEDSPQLAAGSFNSETMHVLHECP